MADKDVPELTRLRKLDFLNLVDGLNGTSLNLAMRLIPPEDRRVVNLRDEYKYAWIAQVCLQLPTIVPFKRCTKKILFKNVSLKGKIQRVRIVQSKWRIQTI